MLYSSSLMFGEKLSKLRMYVKWEMNIYFGIKITFPTAETKWTKPASAFIKKLVNVFFPFVLRTQNNFRGDH